MVVNFQHECNLVTLRKRNEHGFEKMKDTEKGNYTSSVAKSSNRKADSLEQI
jgi:hypothetical protein